MRARFIYLLLSSFEDFHRNLSQTDPFPFQNHPSSEHLQANLHLQAFFRSAIELLLFYSLPKMVASDSLQIIDFLLNTEIKVVQCLCAEE